MRRSRTNTTASIIVFLASLSAVSSSRAHSGHIRGSGTNVPVRTWTNAAGEFQMDGSFVTADDRQVQIRQPDGLLVNLTLRHLSPIDRQWVQRRRQQVQVTNQQYPSIMLVQKTSVQLPPADEPAPSMAKAFEAFVKTGAIRTRWDDHFLYVESSGLPAHRMMVGITAWQQQVPLPQAYVGNNAWQIPRFPVPATKPTSANNRFLRGAIALAVNGVPIFNPLNNRGDDAYLFGELDEFGGHCGRADDYHYHIAPVHLQETIGQGLPIAYALDGFPVYGYEEPDGSQVQNLDAINGHRDQQGNYHYHATKTYPYLNGGFYGNVSEQGGQVDPQPRAQPIRPAMSPLRGATISDFQETAANRYRLTYKLGGQTASVSYSIADNGSVNFSYVDTDGKTTNESYSPRSGDVSQPPRPPSAARAEVSADQPLQRETTPQLIVSSSAFESGGNYPADFTCDGTGQSPPVSWSEGPQGTECFALNLWHIPGPGGIKSYWLLHDIPPDVTSLPRNASGIGVPGYNDKDRTDYDPMCSRGPGAKEYHITVYALSKKPDWPTTKVTRAEMLRTIGDITLAEGTLSFTYTRSARARWLLILAAAVLVVVAAYLTWSIRRRRRRQPVQ